MARPSLWWRVRHAWSVRVVCLAMRHDPRCRASDRTEAAALLSIVVAFVVSLPFAVLAGTNAASRSMVTVRQQELDRHRTVATIASTSGASDSTSLQASQVAITWRRADGRLVRDSMVVDGAPAPGSHLTIWITGDGRRVGSPLTASEAEARGWLLVVGLILVMSLMSLGCLAVVRQMLMRSRIRSWDAEWVEVASGPRS